jgi:hypothetical protein
LAAFEQPGLSAQELREFEVQESGNETSGNGACDIAMVKPHPIASSLHLTVIKRSHSARSMQLKSPYRNDAVHELAAPKPNELELVTGVIEDLLNFFYELDYKASQLREMRRAKRTSAKTRSAITASAQRLSDSVGFYKPANDLPACAYLFQDAVVRNRAADNGCR